MKKEAIVEVQRRYVGEIELGVAEAKLVLSITVGHEVVVEVDGPLDGCTGALQHE